MQKDGHIRLLPVQVANKVAAGEVVERPASVVKEIVENALDAGATRIDVTVTAGGRKLIEIRDNGCGMERGDALMSIERQATSKIRDVHDIEEISTLGFRGEAIPSIASVSRFTLKTRSAASDVGTEIIILGGTLQEVNDAGIPAGTTVEVRDLFFNVPARRKFLRAYQTEQSHIKNVFVLNALAHPEVGFTLTCDGRETYALPPGATLIERMRELFGVDYLGKMRAIEGRLHGIHVYGYAGLPGSGVKEREQQFVFVNRRPASAAVVTYAIKQAYAVKDGEIRPALILFIDMEPALVDVNVHPAKKEVRFNNSAAVREAVIEILRCALTGRGMSSTPTTQASHTDAQRMSSETAGGCSPEKGLTSPTPPISLRTLDRASSAKANGVASASGDVAVPQRMDKVASGNDGLSASVNYVRGVVGAAVVPDVPSPPIEESAELLNLAADGAPWKWCRVIGELRGSFILLETDSGCVTVDPCAALERIYYERLLAFDAEHPPVSQKLLIPESVKLSPVNAEHLRRNLDVLSELGFKIADFGNDYFMVEAMPSILGGGGCREILTNVAGDIAVEGRRRGSARWKEELIARAVSRTRAGSGFKFSSQAAEKLVAQLAECRMPYTCPQGKPTMIFTSFSELERKFGKKR